MPCKDIPIFIKTKYSIKDYLYWNFLILVPSILGSIAIARQSSKLAAAYIILAFLSFSIIQLYFPFNLGLSYSKPKNNLKPVMPCRVSKISKNGKRRRSYFVKIILILVGLILFFFPIEWLVKDLLLLVAYALSWMLLLLTLRRYGFVKCINPEYSANKVFESTTKQCEREEFSQGNNFFFKIFRISGKPFSGTILCRIHFS